ncbi:hypothetical protein ABZ927_35135 [Streptomyces massasporeus]
MSGRDRKEFGQALRTRLFVPDGLEALRRHPGLGPRTVGTPYSVRPLP